MDANNANLLSHEILFPARGYSRSFRERELSRARNLVSYLVSCIYIYISCIYLGYRYRGSVVALPQSSFPLRLLCRAMDSSSRPITSSTLISDGLEITAAPIDEYRLSLALKISIRQLATKQARKRRPKPRRRRDRPRVSSRHLPKAYRTYPLSLTFSRGKFARG